MTAALATLLITLGQLGPAPVQVSHCWPDTISVTVHYEHGRPVRIIEQHPVYRGCSRRGPLRRGLMRSG